MRWAAFAVALAVLCSLAPIGSLAQSAGEAPAQAAPPPEIAELRRLLAAPAVRDWLAMNADTPADVPAQDAETEAAAPVQPTLAALLERISTHRQTIREGIPQVPEALGGALAALSGQAMDHGLLTVALMLAVLIGAGLLAEWRFLRLTRPLRKSVLAAEEETIGRRLGKLAMRVGLAFGAVGVFGIASLGAFVLIDLPPLVKHVAARGLVAAIFYRLVLHSARLLLAPDAPARRVVPMSDDWAAFWLRRTTVFAAVFLVGWTVATSLRVLGAPYPAPLIVAYLFGIGLLGIALATIWGRRARLRAQGAAGIGTAALWSVWSAALFLMWLLGTVKLFWLVFVAGLLPLSVRVVNAAVNHLLREASTADGHPAILTAIVERGARMILFVLAGWTLLWAWGLSYERLLSGDDALAVAGRMVLNLAFIAVAFDFIWHVSRTAIDAHAAVPEGAKADPVEVRRRARLRTLLPILRNVLQIFLAVIAGLMALSSLGVEIGPLIAGAGVVGIAIGFGAQTTVKDVIAGMFYLLDDAFRIGDYIVAGSYKGTVEGFSIRSIKLRHHRGSVYTIPFGSLGAVQNMTREWVIEKLDLTVPFDTDVARLKKVIKGVSAALLSDPELGPWFIEPLKSQGVDGIGDHGLLVKIKFKCIPTKQFTIRRRANSMIQKAFAENGIAFAFPTVRVAGEGGEDGAADGAADADASLAAAARAVAPPAAPA